MPNTDKLTPEQSKAASEQRQAVLAASLKHGFDFSTVLSYFAAFETFVTNLADMLGVAHAVVDAKGNVTPHDIAKVAGDVTNAMSAASSVGVAPEAANKVAEIAATVQTHSNQLAALAEDGKNLAATVTSQQSDIAKGLEAATQLPGILSDLESLKSSAAGVAPAGGSHSE